LGDGEEGLELLARLAPDVVLLDVRMPKLDGVGLLDTLSKTASPPPCVVLTTFDDDELVLRCIARGARGYLLKDVTLKQLTDAIRTVSDGGSVINAVVTERVLRGIERLGAGFEALPVPDALTQREFVRCTLASCSPTDRRGAGVCAWISPRSRRDAAS
jgi:DNA-binding NarL/FixJ family response regulator